MYHVFTIICTMNFQSLNIEILSLSQKKTKFLVPEILITNSVITIINHTLSTKTTELTTACKLHLSPPVTKILYSWDFQT